MKYLDEYRDPDAARRFVSAIEATVKHDWALMEICGGQTHAILKYGIDRLLPSAITLVHGPGCPVCVTPLEQIEKALSLAALPEVIFCSFGDMLRVPGRDRDLLSVKADGGDVRVVYTPTEALQIARDNPQREVVFFAVGFETTAPVCALTVHQALAEHVDNLSILASHVLVPPAIDALLSSPSCRIQGFLAPGHVCTVMGVEEYKVLSERYDVPIVVTGFEPLDILQGIVENQYSRAVRREGNPAARALMMQVFEVVDRKWRGIGSILNSGLRLRDEYRHHDAEARFHIAGEEVEESSECVAGEVLQGIRKPDDCPAFGSRCTPEHPLGATMVSSEGACAAYYHYRPVGPGDPPSPGGALGHDPGSKEKPAREDV